MAPLLATLAPASFPVKHLSEESQDQAVQPSLPRHSARHSAAEETSSPVPDTRLL